MTQVPAITERSTAGLRETLFRVLDDVVSGKMDGQRAKDVVALSRTIIESARVQLEFERLRLASEIPAHLSPMTLVPPLDDAKSKA